MQRIEKSREKASDDQNPGMVSDNPTSIPAVSADRGGGAWLVDVPVVRRQRPGVLRSAGTMESYAFLFWVWMLIMEENSSMSH
jgi:hypothetical protein